MKVLLCHNHYQQPGGEDQSFAAEAQLLEGRGHEVVRFTLSNDCIAEMSRLTVARRTLWNDRVHEELRRLIRRERPALMHCTNTFPLISPSAYYAARAEGVPVVQSLRNYRLLCPNALFLREGRVCEDCLGKSVPWPAIWHGCYRQDRSASAVVATMLTLHRAMGTWTRAVSLYFTLTQFARARFVEAGWDGRRIVVKPNFLDRDPGPGTGLGGYVIFVGRLSPEKGLDTLLNAWERLGTDGSFKPRLKIVGDGPLADQVRRAAERDPAIDWLGRRTPAETLDLIGEATCLVMPSIWYETFGKTIIEAYSRGTPVLASRLGAMAELVHEGVTGALFSPGDPDDLATGLRRLLTDPGSLREQARQEFLRHYTAERNYEQLMAIYHRALALPERTRLLQETHR